MEWLLFGLSEAPVDGGVMSGPVGVPVWIDSLVGEDGGGIGVGEAVAPDCAVRAQGRFGEIEGAEFLVADGPGAGGLADEDGLGFAAEVGGGDHRGGVRAACR